MKWKSKIEGDVLDDQLNEAYRTFEGGGGDCDNISWAGKRLFEYLGCKTGIDYKSRVIGVGSHAVLVYTDTNGKMYSMDQHADIQPFTSIYQASKEFIGSEKEYPREVFLQKINGTDVQVVISQDPLTLEKTNRLLALRLKLPYEGKSNYTKFLPKDWKKYDRLEIDFIDKTTVFYESGILKQENLADGREISHSDPKNYQVTYPGGEVDWEHFENGKLTQRVYRSGKAEVYESDKLIQINHPDGTIETF